MDKLGLVEDLSSKSTDQKQTNPEDQSIQCCIQSLIHACQCQDANCQLQSCKTMEGNLQHAESCRRKTSGCPICKHLIAYHTNYCHEAKCSIPFCLNIKRKLLKEQLQQKLGETFQLKRCIATMARATMQNRSGLPNEISETSPFYLNIEHKLLEEDLQQILEETFHLRNRIAIMDIATMQNRSGLPNEISQTSPGGPTAPPQTSPSPQHHDSPLPP